MKKLLLILIVNIFLLQNIEGQNLIKNLSNGALIIRLKTNENIINYYLDKNDTAQANKEKEKQKNRNIEIIETFQKEWSLSPVYFFYSKYSNQIKENNLNNVFKDIHETKLSESEKIHISNNFVIGYFGKTTGSLKFDALLLTDDKFQLLKKPQPRSVRTYKGLWLLKRKLNRIIQILDRKIRFYYLRIQ